MRILTVALACFILSASAAASRGHETGDGGDLTAVEFVSTAYEVVARLTLHPIEGVDVAKLLTVIGTTKVLSQAELSLNGYPVSAINYRKRTPALIEVSRVAWNEPGLSSFAKKRLVLHEYLGVLSIDDSNYQLSSRLDTARVCSRSLTVRTALEKSLGLSCDRIDLQDFEKLYTLLLDYRLKNEAPLKDDLLELKALRFLEVRFPDGTRIDDDFLHDQDQVRELTTSGGDYRKGFGFIRNAASVSWLSLRGEFGTLSRSDFSSLSNVEELAIAPVSLRGIEAYAFADLPKLRYLQIHPRGYSRTHGPYEYFFERFDKPTEPMTLPANISDGAFAGLTSLEFLMVGISPELPLRKLEAPNSPLSHVRIEILGEAGDDFPREMRATFPGLRTLQLWAQNPDRVFKNIERQFLKLKCEGMNYFSTEYRSLACRQERHGR